VRFFRVLEWMITGITGAPAAWRHVASAEAAEPRAP
jgi:hypothetical protein